MTTSTRVYVPATMADLETLHRSGHLEASIACAVTGALRESLADEDTEALEHEALLDAAELSVDRLTSNSGVARRRVVIAADLPTSGVVEAPSVGMSVVRVLAPVLLGQVVSVHVDERGGDPGVGPEELAELDLLWFSVEEIASLLDPR
jgi:hypothetical protein